MDQPTATETNKPQSQRHLQEADQALRDQQAGLSFGDENTTAFVGRSSEAQSWGRRLPGPWIVLGCSVPTFPKAYFTMHL